MKRPRNTKFLRIYQTASHGPWVALSPLPMLNEREARVTAKRLLEMAEWIKQQKAKRGHA